jgi:hypothetical protein
MGTPFLGDPLGEDRNHFGPPSSHRRPRQAMHHARHHRARARPRTALATSGHHAPWVGPALFWAAPGQATGAAWPSRVGHVRQRELDHRALSACWPGFCLKSFFLFSFNLDSIQTSEIHIFLYNCPKFMKPTPLDS